MGYSAGRQVQEQKRSFVVTIRQRSVSVKHNRVDYTSTSKPVNCDPVMNQP